MLRHRSIHISVEVVALALAFCAVAAARDVDPTAARDAFDEAERLYQLGRFEEAIASYEKAYALDAQPAFLYNIALAHRRQYEIDKKPEHLRRARELYRNYLLLEPTTPRRAGIERLIEELGARLEKESAPALSPPRLTAPQPPTPALIAAPAPEPPRRSSAGWWIAGGAAVVAGVVLVVLLTRGGSGTDGPTVNLGGKPR
jgi:tetratricopeptide (TPR) repeat protein